MISTLLVHALHSHSRRERDHHRRCADRRRAADVVRAPLPTRHARQRFLLAPGGGRAALAPRLRYRAESSSPLVASPAATTGHAPGVLPLDEYRARLGESEMPLPALSLWQRIEHRDEAHEACAGDAPFVGRVDVMRRIWSAVASARSSRGVAILLWGPAGIGKTRIIREVERGAAAASVRVLTANAHPIHAVGAQSFMRHLVAFLVSEPGAIGCEPRAYATLRQLANSEAAPDAAHHPAMLFDALIELIAALTDESPLVIMIDDAQWLHESIWPLWRAIFRWSADRRVLWLVGFRAFREEEL